MVTELGQRRIVVLTCAVERWAEVYHARLAAGWTFLASLALGDGRVQSRWTRLEEAAP